MTRRGIALLTGRSPLTRGRLGHTQLAWQDLGSIPAHAGKTAWCMATASASWVDPRSRGEDRPRKGNPGRVWGRSPLTRGRQADELPIGWRGGSIPAHAGKTCIRGTAAGEHQVDPRSRGEDTEMVSSGVTGTGRSPLTRGRPVAARHQRAQLGSIPAHAGKTRTAWPGSRHRRVDPRSRGEDEGGALGLGGSQGRSPLTRGRQAEIDARRNLEGSIPAHAGKTHACDDLLDRSGVDPRSRGEDASAPLLSTCAPGRSPLTRGRRTHRRRVDP